MCFKPIDEDTILYKFQKAKNISPASLAEEAQHLIKKGDYPLSLSLLFAMGLEEQYLNDVGRSWLHLAVKNNRYKIVQFLIKENYHFVFDKKDNYGKTILHYAAQSGSTTILQYLLDYRYLKEKFLDINIQDENGYTSLQIAVISGNFAIVKLLIENGAYLESRAQNILSPLYLALLEAVQLKKNKFGKYLNIINLLVFKGANRFAKNKDGVTIIKFFHKIKNNYVQYQVSYKRIKKLKKALLHPLDIPVTWFKFNAALTKLQKGKQNDIGFLFAMKYWQQNYKIKIPKVLQKYILKINQQMHPPLIELKDIEKLPTSTIRNKILTTQNLKQPRKSILELMKDKIVSSRFNLLATFKHLHNMLDFFQREQNETPLIHIATSYPGEAKSYTKYILNKGYDINAQDSNGKTALHVALENIDRKTVMLLIDMGARVDILDNCENTLLHVLASEKSYGTARDNEFDIYIYNLIKSLTSKLDSQNINGDTALHLAVDRNALIAVRLINMGANVNIINFKSQLPLHLVVKSITIYSDIPKIKPIISCLLKKTKDKNLRDVKGKTALQYIPSITNRLEIYELFLPNMEKAKTWYDFNKGIFELIKENLEKNSSKESTYKLPERGNNFPRWLNPINLTKYLPKTSTTLLKGTILNIVYPRVLSRSEFGCKYFNGYDHISYNPESDMLRCLNSNYIYALCYLLANYSAKYIIKNLYDENDHANMRKLLATNLSYCKYLFNYKEISSNYFDYRHEGTILHHSVKVKKYAFVKLFLEYGAFVNIKDSFGNTPLHYAVANKSLELCKLIIERGADLNSINNSGFPIIYYALLNGNNDKVVNLLLEHGVNINFVNNKNETPLVIAIKEGNKIACEKLLQNGADINYRFKDEQTLLHFAVKFSMADISKMLIKFNANKNLKDTYGNKPLDRKTRFMKYAAGFFGLTSITSTICTFMISSLAFIFMIASATSILVSLALIAVAVYTYKKYGFIFNAPNKTSIKPTDETVKQDIISDQNRLPKKSNESIPEDLKFLNQSHKHSILQEDEFANLITKTKIPAENKKMSDLENSDKNKFNY